ncbi:uncharacterized protein LOC125498783 [Beta vulgaris subsp. vulgaris]|uniref:uncharacterized protein LOC125498783 n=1 Tax=Beta vulgaris subsp. vulgaris TaxID=3555 RepID=UPI0020369DEA|nr:uncharacterized protein LOC125498783 [Beta vulgaris subsp. vulgaris]
MPIPQRLSWPVKKILNSRDLFQEFNAQQMLERKVFSIKKLYKCMQGEHDKVNWRRIICNNSASPKAIFITWLTLHDKLATKSRLYSGGIAPDKQCVLCENADETKSHLFFDCPTANIVWKICLQQIRLTYHKRNFCDEVQLVANRSHNKSPQAQLYTMFFTEALYRLWTYRNSSLVFARVKVDTLVLCKQIIFNVACRCAEDVRRLLIV